MTIGLQIFDANGKLTLDATKRIGKIVAYFETGTTNSSRVVPELQDAGTPFVFITSDADYFTENFSYPNVEIIGTTVSWNFIDYKIPVTPFSIAPRRSVVINLGIF